MTSPFREHIRQSLANETLQIALDNNAERRVQGRINAFASLPDWKERRQQAHAIRADVIEHLDEYLEQFTINAQNNGITIHRAKDAAEAIQIFLKITKDLPQSHGEHREEQEESLVPPSDLRGKKVLIAKSKSMVSEELDFNQVLETKGMRVVETDLGEYIVQLRGEKPAHIITPAVHLRRQEVGQLFHEKLREPYTEDIPTLVNVARRVLREVFLTADIGVSGANFGIAETGGICLVTNEGNGRMVTTLPPIHIALMGMERLVRNLDDLAIMLSLLPRSATGQKLSVYTQIIHKPLDGQQRHIIILDNGRTRLRNSPLKESLYCIRCGSCLNACPVFREIGGHAYVGKSGAASPYSGPIGSVISAGLFGSDFVPLAQASSLCGACKDACPVDIDLPKLLTRVRAGLSETREGKRKATGLSSMGKLFLQIFGCVATHPSLFAVSQRLAALGTHLVSPFSTMVRMPAVTGWGYSKDLPRFASKPFRARFKPADSKASRLSSEKPTPPSGDVGVQPIKHDFITELTAVGGHVVETNANELTRKITEFLKSRNINRIHLEPNVLDENALKQAGITISHEADPGIRVGVTKAICGLADTGSILEADGEGDKIQASLLTEVHIAVLNKSDILPSLVDALPLTRQTQSAVFITGPSRTGDIEMSLTIGVHGPGEVHVFLVDDSISG